MKNTHIQPLDVHQMIQKHTHMSNAHTPPSDDIRRHQMQDTERIIRRMLT